MFHVCITVTFATGKIFVHGYGQSNLLTNDFHKHLTQELAKTSICRGEYESVPTLVKGLSSYLTVQVVPVNLYTNPIQLIELDFPMRTITITEAEVTAQCSFEEFTR